MNIWQYIFPYFGDVTTPIPVFLYFAFSILVLCPGEFIQAVTAAESDEFPAKFSAKDVYEMPYFCIV